MFTEDTDLRGYTLYRIEHQTYKTGFLRQSLGPKRNRYGPKDIDPQICVPDKLISAYWCSAHDTGVLRTKKKKLVMNQRIAITSVLRTKTGLSVMCLQQWFPTFQI